MKLRLSAVCLIFWVMTLASFAQQMTCDICGATINHKYFYKDDLAIGGRVNICTNCEEIKDFCFSCNLPVREPYSTLPDGRILCTRDAAAAVSSEEEAKQICADVKDDLDRLFSRYLTFPGTNILVSIVNRFYLENLFKMPGEGQACVSVYGATTSNRLPGNKMIHSVAILSHLRKSRLMAVCAHEYTHAWMGENVPRERLHSIDKDTIEAFCELIAYKYMESKHETFEMENITKNNYTKGKILVLIAADRQFGFNAVLDWINGGDDATFDLANLQRVRAVQGAYVPAAAAQASQLFLPAATMPAYVPPDTLVLKSISGTGARRFAMINSTTFEIQEKARVRVGQTNLTVRCLSIGDSSVTIQVDGSTERKQLFLRNE